MRWPLDTPPDDCSPEVAARLGTLFDARLRDEPYVPGLTPRPSGGVVFEIAKRAAGFDPANLRESEAWVAGHLLALRGYYWEAHEVWEKVWAGLPPNSIERTLVQAWIQLANACLKARMGRPRAAQRLTAMARALFREAKTGAPAVKDPFDDEALFQNLTD